MCFADSGGFQLVRQNTDSVKIQVFGLVLSREKAPLLKHLILAYF